MMMINIIVIIIVVIIIIIMTGWVKTYYTNILKELFQEQVFDEIFWGRDPIIKYLS